MSTDPDAVLTFVDPAAGRGASAAKTPNIFSAAVRNGLSAAGGAITRLRQMVFRKSNFRLFNLGGTRIDYLREVGDGTGSSTVAAVLNWIARTFPEAPPTLWQELENG